MGSDTQVSGKIRRTEPDNGLSQGTEPNCPRHGCDSVAIFELAFDWTEMHSPALAQLVGAPQVRSPVSVKQQTKLGFRVVRKAESEGLNGFPARVHNYEMLFREA